MDIEKLEAMEVMEIKTIEDILGYLESLPTGTDIPGSPGPFLPPPELFGRNILDKTPKGFVLHLGNAFMVHAWGQHAWGQHAWGQRFTL